MSASTTGWQAMGKPDFSQCAKFFYRLPADLREGLNRSEEKVLIWTLFLSWTTSFHAGRTGTITSFSETWVGNKFGRSRWTVARALHKLEECSLVKRIRRSPKKDGTYQTNLIALTAKLSSLLGLLTRQVVDKSPCSKSAPQGMRNGYKREKTTVSNVPVSHSLSLSGLPPSRENDWGPAQEEKRVEKGTLMRLYLELKGT